MDKKIELELRAEIPTQDKESFKKHIEEVGNLHSHTERLSVMYFGNINAKKLDVRVRVTNRECEVAMKSGDFGAHDRVEVTQKIDSEEFLGMVKIFAQFGFVMKVGERETFNYTLPNDITVSLVFAGHISYIELEKMSSEDEVEENNKLLKQWADQLGLQLLNSEEEFDMLCERLSKEVDWKFNGTDEEYVKLNELFNSYLRK